MQSNAYVWLRRLLGRPTCVLGDGARLAASARVINMSPRSSSIAIGTGSFIRGELLVFAHGGRISIGDWCFVGEGSRIWSGRGISIGDRVLVSHGVNIMDTPVHSTNARDRHAHFRHIVERGHPKALQLDEQEVVLKDDCWVAAGATILKGVTVGKGAIVGAAAVVCDDVPDFTLVVGNPARVVRSVDPSSRELGAP